MHGAFCRCCLTFLRKTLAPGVTLKIYHVALGAIDFTLDVAWVNHSPVDEARTDYRVGDTGLLVRSQIQYFL